MYAAVILALGLLLQVYLEKVSDDIWGLAQMYQSRGKAMKTVQLAETLDRYYLEKEAFPASLVALKGTPGFEHASGLIDNWQGYGVSGTLTDGVWQFRRAVLVVKDPSSGESIADYMADNNCGTGSYSTAASWCGKQNGRWYRKETRETFNDSIVNQRLRLNRMLQKFADHYSAKGEFPSVNASGGALAANSMTTVAALAAYSGTAAACSGAFEYEGVPVDCSDMFDMWGNKVGYQFISKRRVVLTSEAPIYNNSGTRVVVAAELDNTP